MSQLHPPFDPVEQDHQPLARPARHDDAFGFDDDFTILSSGTERHQPADPVDPPPLHRPRRDRPRRDRTRPHTLLGLSRRNLLAGVVSAAAAAGGGGTLLLAGPDANGTAKAGPSGAAAGPGSAPTTAQPAAAKKKIPFALPKNLDQDLLISRVTYGRTAGLDRAVDRGPTAWLQGQLAPSTLKDHGGDAVDARFPRLEWSTATVHRKLKGGDWTLMTDTVAAHLGRAIWGDRQLLEVMTDFWANHLNVTCPSDDVWDTRHRYQIDVIRKHALGSFEALLKASAVHPSMLMYLNNAQSTGQNPNENYARELLELHTVGVNAGYTEHDVKQAALLLTGWTVQDGRAVYVPANHHAGPVRVMGFRSANPSRSKGRTAQNAYLHHLARHPRTATMIATKLAHRFVSDAPPAALVKRLAASYRKHGTAIVPVLRDLFSSPEFARSGGEKIRRPMEYIVATARATGVTLGKDSSGVSDLVWMLNDMGHMPLNWPTPDGYADVASAWQSPAAALAQFNATASIVHGWWPTALKLPGPKHLLATPPRTRSGVITAVGHKVFGRTPTARETAAARKLLAGTTLPSSFGAGSWEQQETVALTTIVFLSAPAHALR
jgi:Protein of unknown function (DUF1800)